MKRFNLVVAILGLIFVPVSVSAHQLKSDGSIGAVLHVDPNDDPIVGAATSFFFELKDKNDQFKLSNCDCRVSVSRGNKELIEEPLLPDGTARYTFLEKGVYTISLEGKPLSEPTFTPFSLKYDVRVSKTISADGTVKSEFSWSPIHILHLLLILAVAGYTVYQIVLARNNDDSNITKKGIK